MALEKNQTNFKAVTLGQTIIKYQVPKDIFITINNIYERKYKDLQPANKQLAGKIKKEHGLFYRGHKDIKDYNVLSLDVLNWFEKMFTHYLKNTLSFNEHQKQIVSIWVNEMKEHEYNPIHVHSGSLFTGLSSVMILKLPESFGVEYSADHTPTNGKLEILGNSTGYFATTDYSPKLLQGDFYVFPYDLRHCVYPFNGSGTRRTLSCNCDVQYNPLINRGRS